MRHDDVIRIAAVAIDAERARLRAQMLVAGNANRALAAADPRKHQAHLAGPDTLGVRPGGDHFADGLVAHGQREGNAAVLERHALAVTEIVAALPDVQVAVADARRLDAQ